jgi:hypothetical protein
MGAVYKESLRDLQTVLKCNERELRKLGRKMSETVIMGVMEIWRHSAHSAHEIQINTNDEVRTLIEEEIVELEREAAMNQRETGNELELEEAEGQQEGDDEEYETEHRTEESEIIFGPESGYEDGFLYMPGQGFMALGERRTQEELDRRRMEFERREETNTQGDQADYERDDDDTEGTLTF